MTTHASLTEDDSSSSEIRLMGQFELFSEGPCQAIYEDGPCDGEGRVEIVSRDWYSGDVAERVLFCFECAIEALSETVWKENESG